MIAREGAVAVALSTVVSGVLLFAGQSTAGGALLALAAVLAWVFRDPLRPLPSAPLDVVSAVDGVVSEVERGRHRWFEGESLRVSIRVAWPGVRVVRAPIEARVHDVSAARRDGLKQGSPDDYAVHLRTDEGDDVVYVVRSDWPVSRFRSYAAIGERVGHGRRCGFVYFCTRVDVLIPGTAEKAASVGNRVVGGLSTIARLTSRQSADPPDG